MPGGTAPVVVGEPHDANASAVGAMHLRAWHETHDAAGDGLDAAWVEEHIGSTASPATDAFRRAVFAAQRADPGRTHDRVARPGGEVVAFVHASRPTEQDDDEARLEALHLLRSVQGSGLADRLLASTVAWAAGRALRLEASPLSVRAVPSYRRHGFLPTGETGRYREVVPTLVVRRPPASRAMAGGP